jgi:hypothetical protein
MNFNIILLKNHYSKYAKEKNSENIDLMLEFYLREHADGNLTGTELITQCTEYVKIKYTLR